MKKFALSMKHVAAIGLLALLAWVPGSSQSVSDQKSGPVSESDSLPLQTLIKKMENDRIQAGVRKDVNSIAAVTAEDYVNIDFDGQLRNKTETLERIRSN